MLMLDNDDDVKDEDIELVDIIVSKKGNSNWDRNNMKVESSETPMKIKNF